MDFTRRRDASRRHVKQVEVNALDVRFPSNDTTGLERNKESAAKFPGPQNTGAAEHRDLA